jgi:hypothetical protein
VFTKYFRMNTALIIYIVGILFLLYLLRIMRSSFSSNAPTAKYNAERVYRIRAYKMLKAILRALEEAKFELANVSRSGDEIVAISNVSMRSWSEHITIRVVDKSDECTVRFKSVCAMPTQVFDWGKNRKNAQEFFRKLDSNLA